MQVTTALDLIGIKPRTLDKWSHALTCPWCGDDAWTSQDFFQCFNSSCTIQAAAPEDLIAHHAGGYAQAAYVVAERLSRPVNTEVMVAREIDRKVMDLWIEFCTSALTSDSSTKTNHLQAQGLGVGQSKFNARVLNVRQMKRLVDMADQTGAEMPDSWRQSPPGVSLCLIVQSRPHTIDRIVVMGRGGRSQTIVWHRYAAGFCGLIGLSYRRPRLLAADSLTAMRVQHRLAAQGEMEEICSVYRDDWSGTSCPPWRVNAHLLTAIPRSADPLEKDDLKFSDTDFETIQFAMDHFKGVASSLRAIPMSHILDIRPRKNHFAWNNLRWGGIVSLISPDDTQMPPTAQAVFEKTGTRQEDAAHMIAYFNNQGRTSLAADIERHSLTRVIFRDQRLVVKETANEYQIHHRGTSQRLANFSLKVTASVSFDEVGEAYCQAVLRCGRATLSVLFPQNLLQDRVNSLEEELKRQIASKKKTTTAGKLPTVIDAGKFRTYVMQHLKEQVASAPLISGIDRLGWSTDRKSFNFPGFTVDTHGRHDASEFLCPSIPVLRLFEAAPTWAEICPDDLDRSCHDIISMLIASCVRHYRLCATHPITVAQTSVSTRILEKITMALGQTKMHELNQNVRDGGKILGIHGYPILAVGPRALTLQNAGVPYIHLTDSGYMPPTSPSGEQIAAAARAVQFALARVVEWCISTGADDFQEVQSIQHHRSLMREGQWLMMNVCGIAEWEISAPEPTAIEKLLAQIPYDEAGRRMTLVDGQELIIDVHDLDQDHDGILREARSLGTIAAIDNGKLVSPAAKMLPAISTYYGMEPDVTMITSP